MFEVENRTKKHELQASWKRVAMVLIEGDVSEYYSWYIKKRYNLVLNPPLRKAHVTFINDRVSDMKLADEWNNVKAKWDGITVPIMLNLEPRTDGKHWWLNIPHEYRETLQSVRNEVGLGKPYFGLHLTLGYANEKNIDHSNYIHTLIKKGFIN